MLSSYRIFKMLKCFQVEKKILSHVRKLRLKTTVLRLLFVLTQVYTQKQVWEKVYMEQSKHFFSFTQEWK